MEVTVLIYNAEWTRSGKQGHNLYTQTVATMHLPFSDNEIITANQFISVTQ